MKFWLGSPESCWLERTSVPLFVSRNRIARIKRRPTAIGEWAMDSGGFTELSMHGKWRITAAIYSGFVCAVASKIGGLAWAAPQDWMCEPHMVERTGLSVEEHQRRTVENYMELSSMPAGRWVIPVLQGWELPDYVRCVRMYEECGVDLRRCQLVGLGSVCRRQNTREAVEIVRELHGMDMRLHGFGFKRTGILACGDMLVSADSMAWSLKARRENIRLDSCTHAAPRCANCMAYALQWRDELLSDIEQRKETP